MRTSHLTTIKEIDYPSSDGKPMAETELHGDWMVTIAQRLKRFYAGKRVYVGCNLFVYYEEGNPRKSVAPDAFVVKNCKPGRRDTFLIWEEGRTPNFVLETTSKTTRRKDNGKKKQTYAEMKVAEYFLYDPRGEWLKPPLQGFRLKGDDYEPIPIDEAGGILSAELGIRFVVEEDGLAMFDAATGERLLSQEEFANQQKLQAEDAEQRAEEAEQRANAAEQRALALEAELARLRDADKKTNGHQRKNGK